MEVTDKTKELSKKIDAMLTEWRGKEEGKVFLFLMAEEDKEEEVHVRGGVGGVKIKIMEMIHSFVSDGSEIGALIKRACAISAIESVLGAMKGKKPSKKNAKTPKTSKDYE